MASEVSGQTTTVTTEGGEAVAANPAPAKGEWKCPLSDPHVHREDVRKVWRECQEESFWHRALPLSLGSMAVTGGLIYNGVWKSSKRFGPFPKLAVAGILGYAVGKASYVGTCRSKFQGLGIADEKGFGPGFGPWSKGGRMGPFSGSGPGHRFTGMINDLDRSCHHVCEECKKMPQAAPEEEVKS